jgi:hypothetical protein
MPVYTPDTPKYDIEVRLTDECPNAWAILAHVDEALRKHGVSVEERKAVMKQAMDGDYDHLLWFVSCMVFVT